MVVAPQGNVKMGKKLVVGAALFSKGMYGVVAGNQPGPEYVVISADSLAARSVSASSIFGSTNIATDSIGVKASFIFTCAIPSMALSGDVWVQIPWRIVTGSAGSAVGRVNLDVLKNGSSFVTKALGPLYSLSPSATDHVDYLHVRMPSTEFGPGAGDRLQFTVEIEVTTASGSGGSTAVTLLRHDPETSGNELIIEVIV